MRYEDFVADPDVKRWRKTLADSTAETRLPLLFHFFEFLGISPSNALAHMRDNPSFYGYVDTAYEWLDRKPLAVSTKQTRLGMLRGFFECCRAPLPRERHKFHSVKEPVFGEMGIDAFRLIWASCNVMYRAIFTSQFQMGAGNGELLYVNTHHAELVYEEVKKRSHLILVTMPGRKHSRNKLPYYTFLGPDAITCLRRYFHNQGWKRDSVLFRNEYDHPIATQNLSRYFREHAMRVGVIKRQTPNCLDCGGETVRKYHKEGSTKKTHYLCTACQKERPVTDYPEFNDPNFRCGIRYATKTHEIRDLFRTEFHRAATYAGADLDVAKFIMGHGYLIDPNKYDKIMRDTAYTKHEYRKALPFLNILSEDPRKVPLTTVQEMRRREQELIERIQRLEQDKDRRLANIEETLKDFKELRKMLTE